MIKFKAGDIYRNVDVEYFKIVRVSNSPKKTSYEIKERGKNPERGTDWTDTVAKYLYYYDFTLVSSGEDGWE